MKQISALLFLVLFLASASLAQDTIRPVRSPLQHEMTPDELLRKGEIGRGFVPTDPPVSPVRNLAEFDRMQGAMVRYPFGIPISLIKEMAEDVMVTTIVASVAQKTTVINQYVANGVDTSHCNFLIAPSDSYWTRDYGPWFETDSAGQVGIVDFPYNRPRPNDDEIPKKMAAMLGIPWFGMEVISTGGDYMTDGFGISSSTDLVWVENPSQTPAEIDQKMLAYLGVTNYQVVPDPNISSSIDHIDCWGKFLTPDKMLIRKVLTSDPEYNALESAAAYWAAQTCSFGYPYKIYRVKTPQDQPYTNSVILNNKVLVPFMNSAWDDSAKAVYEAAMPGYEVIGFIGNPSTPWMSTDALHCRVMGIGDVGLLHIKHLPLSGNQPCESDYAINADIVASSQQPVIADSAIIHYRVNSGAYQTALMVNTAGRQYTGFIPKQPAGSVINYYLTAADESGRSASAPFIGAADPYTFQTVYTKLAAVPDTLWFITPNDCLYGKVTQLHNFTPGTIDLDAVQMTGVTLPWYVDSLSVAVPYAVSSGDSVAVRVKMPLPVLLNPAILYKTDSLRITAANGSFHVIIRVNSDLLSEVGETGAADVLGNTFPNPFNAETTIPLDIRRKGNVKLEITDLRGRTVRTLLSGMLESGPRSITWDGTDDGGNKLADGIYLCRLLTGTTTKTTRITLIR